MPAVLVHGVPDTPRLWDGVRAHLARTDIVTPQLPGFDAPVPDGWTATKEEYASWLADQVEAIGEPVDLVGHDWGSLLVQRVVSTRPELIRTWTAGAGPVDRNYVWHDMAQMWQTPEVGEQIMDAMNGETFVDALAPMVGREVAAEMESHITPTMKSCILSLYRSAVNVGAEWADEVDTITKPGLVVWGADDPYVGREFGERLAERTGARLVMFPDSGHWWPVTKPAEVARELNALWSAVSGPRT
jgi:pimeloyl-ACP methyl ester carboxylesterase